MRITDVRISRVVQPMQDTAWRFAKAQVHERHGLLFAVETDEGPAGLGLADQGLHVGEAIEPMQQVADRVLAPLLIGRDPRDIEALAAAMASAAPAFSRTRAGLETALWDVAGKALGVPVYRLLGGKVRDRIPVIRILPIKSPAEMAANAEAVVAAGYRYLKVKVGLDATADVERVRAIRSAVGPTVTLTLDANEGWTPDEAVRALGAMEDLNVALVEQPVRADDHAGLARVRAAVAPLVEADESASSLGDILVLVRAGCVDSVSLKTWKLGGLLGARKGAAVCEAAGLRCRIGMGGASRIQAAADMQVIASTPGIDFACEVGEFARMTWDPFEGLEVVDGELHVPEEPGIGVRLRPRPVR